MNEWALVFCVCVQKFPTDKAYFIAKELLTTERTYIKDLQVITEVSGPPLDVSTTLCLWRRVCRGSRTGRLAKIHTLSGTETNRELQLDPASVKGK